MKTGSTSYIRERFLGGLLRRKSLPQSKVSARLRLNVLCWCTSEARKYSIRSACNRNVGRDDFLLNCNSGFKKHTADCALIA